MKNKEKFLLLPNTWKLVRLGDFVEKEKGKKPKRENITRTIVYHMPYIDIEAFESGILKSWTDGEGCKLSSENDFLMVWDGSRSGLVGKGLNGALGSTLVRINFPGIYNDYAFYFLNSKFLEINTRAKGSGTPHVDPDLLWNYNFPVPPFDEQKRIVAKIEELFSELDKSLENLQKVQELLKVYRQLLLKSAFEGKLTEKWRKINSISPWRIDKLSNLTSKVGSGSTPKGGGNTYKTTGIPLIRSMNVHFSGFSKKGLVFIDKLQAKSLDNVIVEDGDVLLNITGASIGRVTIPPEDMKGSRVNQHVCILRCISKLINNNFLRYYLMSSNMQNFISLQNYGVTRQALTKRQILDLDIPLPTMKEQEIIVRKISKMFDVINLIYIQIQLQQTQINELRQSILNKAFSGGLIPQDSTDEPANILLERIKTEQANQKNQPTKSIKRKKVSV